MIHHEYYIIRSLHLSRRKFKLKRFFYRLPAELLEEEGGTVAIVYALLLDACAEGTFRADLKVETIAKKGKYTTRSVISAINRLVEIGLVKRVKEGRRTVYDVVPILPAKKREHDYVSEEYFHYGETYTDMLQRIPDATVRQHYQAMIERLGFPLDEKAVISLRGVSAFYSKSFSLEELQTSDLGDKTRLAETGAMTRFTDYDEDEKTEFEGQLSFFGN